jgi:hypothetical protein
MAATATKEVEQKSAVVDVKATYTTPEELAQYERMLDKTFVRKEAREGDKAVFKVVHIAPQFKGVVAEREKVDRFYVQKYERLKGAIAGVEETYSTSALLPIDDPSDHEASFFIDAKEFVAKFKLEQV